MAPGNQSSALANDNCIDADDSDDLQLICHTTNDDQAVKDDN